ncbi:uncharacterized protein DNG_00989 [Cephalotrichum gorgonifer]|uniref:Uncharacterized protein n=1 Tax=Cephalotrichum gorgonifer TaxID=2041049 RepID=A0AAE8MQE2_9PEZI|nr:uncharacterized protein DNG_00989 [Cephalotrichum gorgonifer]
MTTPDRARRTENPTAAPLANAAKSRAKRKRVGTVDDSDSGEVMAVVDEFVRTSGNPAHEFESITRQDSSQRPNGTTLSRQESGLFAGERPSSKGRLSEEEFDSLIYGQDGTAQLPRGRLFVRTNRAPQQNRPDITAGQSQRATPCLYVHMDPRIHWTHKRSEEWHRKKEEEIMFRGTRKENFGKAVERMQAKRLQEALVRQATSAHPARKDSEFGRHVDFGDVPESELPDIVKSNPEWLRATAWMRKCRQKSLERQREIERRQKAGLPWKGLLGPSGIK